MAALKAVAIGFLVQAQFYAIAFGGSGFFPDVTEIEFESIPPAGFQGDVDEISVSCGYGHTCAIEASPATPIGGKVRCWGMNSTGQLVHEKITGDFVQISAGMLHSCGVAIDETVTCWGHEDVARSPTGLFLQVSVGTYHACGIKKDHSIHCWGRNYDGQTQAPPGEYIQVSSGQDNSCALRLDGAVVCWGGNKKGQSLAPTDKQFTQVTTSYDRHACALDFEGYAHCWGKQVENKRRPPRIKFSQISTGHDTSCGISLEEKKVVCWGSRSGILHRVPTDHAFTQISVGNYHACGVTEDGELVCWGDGYNGRTSVPEYFVAG